MPDAGHHGDAQLRGDRLLATLDDMDAGDYVSSGTFFVGGYGWSIKFFPGGDGCPKDDEAAAYTMVRLSLLDGPTGVRVKFSISLLFGSRISNWAADSAYTFFCCMSV